MTFFIHINQCPNTEILSMKNIPSLHLCKTLLAEEVKKIISLLTVSKEGLYVLTHKTFTRGI